MTEQMNCRVTLDKNFNLLNWFFGHRVCGGVSNNDFVCQSIADICQVIVSRPPCVEASIRGVALLAGNTAGIWKNF